MFRNLQCCCILFRDREVPRSDDVAQVVHRFLEEMAFLQIEGEPGAVETVENRVEMGHMLRRSFGEDDDIIQIHQAGLPGKP